MAKKTARKNYGPRQSPPVKKHATARQSPAVKIHRRLTGDQMQDLTERLQRLRDSINDAIDGTWQVTNEGLQALSDSCLEIAAVLDVDILMRDDDDAPDKPVVFTGEATVCAHEITFYYKDFKAVLTDDLKKKLQDEAEEKAKTDLNENTVSGELNCLYVHPDTQKDEEIRGWWQLKSQNDT